MAWHEEYTPPGMSPVSFWGNGQSAVDDFRDMFVPKPEKNEWGVDVIERQIKGPLPGFEKFYNALGQGGRYVDNGVTYYVQTYKPTDDKIFPGASIQLKGLSKGVPNQLVSGGQVELSGTLSVSSPQKATRSLRYMSWKTVYRYILNSKPSGPSNSKIDVNIDPSKSIIFSEILDENGKPYYGNAPAALVTALTPVGFDDIATLDSYNRIIGTPYFECQDTVTRFLPVQ